MAASFGKRQMIINIGHFMDTQYKYTFTKKRHMKHNIFLTLMVIILSFNTLT